MVWKLGFLRKEWLRRRKRKIDQVTKIPLSWVNFCLILLCNWTERPLVVQFKSSISQFEQNEVQFNGQWWYLFKIESGHRLLLYSKSLAFCIFLECEIHPPYGATFDYWEAQAYLLVKSDYIIVNLLCQQTIFMVLVRQRNFHFLIIEEGLLVLLN